MKDDPLGDRVTPFEQPRRRLARGTGDTGTATWDPPAPDVAARARVSRPLAPAARLLRVRGSGDVTLGHVLPVRAGDVGSVAGHWSLEVAVLARPGAVDVDVWWRGYPFAVVRHPAQLPWLERLSARHPVSLIDGDHALRVIDAFAHLRAGPLELLVARA